MKVRDLQLALISSGVSALRAERLVRLCATTEESDREPFSAPIGESRPPYLARPEDLHPAPPPYRPLTGAERLQKRAEYLVRTYSIAHSVERLTEELIRGDFDDD